MFSSVGEKAVLIFWGIGEKRICVGEGRGW